MATLLQQQTTNNCIKNAANNGKSSNNSTTNKASIIHHTFNSVSSSTASANSTIDDRLSEHLAVSDLIDTPPKSSISAAGSSAGLNMQGVTGRDLLPHEMVNAAQPASSLLLPHQQQNNHHSHFHSHHHNSNSHGGFSNSFGFNFGGNHNHHSHHGIGGGLGASISAHHLPHNQPPQTANHLHLHSHQHQHHSHLPPHLHGSVPATTANHYPLPHQQHQLRNASVPDSTTANHAHHHLPQHHQHSSASDRLSPSHGHNSNSSSSTSATTTHPDGGAATAADAQQAADEAAAAAAAEQEPEPEIDIVINNVVCSFSVRCHLNLREIALNGVNVEFRRENGMVTMKLRRPYTTASIWSSGRITCTGATSEDQAKVAARRYARCLQKLGFNVRFRHFRVVNVLGTCSMPWAIKIVNFSEKYKKDASYEPELHPGVTYKLKWPKATLKIFSTGSITVTANSVENVQKAIEHIFPLVYEFRKKRAPDDPKLLKQQAAAAAAAAAASAAAEAAAAAAETAATEAAKSATNATAASSSSTAVAGKGVGTALLLPTSPKAAMSKTLKRKRPFGLAANDPADHNMYVSDMDDEEDDDDEDDVDDLIEEDFGIDDDDDEV